MFSFWHGVQLNLNAVFYLCRAKTALFVICDFIPESCVYFIYQLVLNENKLHLISCVNHIE
ncbi:hypothetical protein A1D23_11495 [Chelonobacter oris]|uniref:Uncharacterized protein n=1 Tax=Chelonobacter oris TaxID=505317 RepID=A0A0A3AR72_9PAST|nr:hypothetical protein OA57_10845 [Chelonobacter oris]MDH3001076.1 hypothetical protein [Chelonobacter oris]